MGNPRLLHIPYFRERERDRENKRFFSFWFRVFPPSGPDPEPGFFLARGSDPESRFLNDWIRDSVNLKLGFTTWVVTVTLELPLNRSPRFLPDPIVKTKLRGGQKLHKPSFMGEVL